MRKSVAVLFAALSLVLVSSQDINFGDSKPEQEQEGDTQVKSKPEQEQEGDTQVRSKPEHEQGGDT